MHKVKNVYSIFLIQFLSLQKYKYKALFDSLNVINSRPRNFNIYFNKAFFTYFQTKIRYVFL